MTFSVRGTADNILTVMEATTTPGTTPLFDEVWLGGPQILPTGDQVVGTVQAVEEYNFTDNICPTHYSSQCMFYAFVEVSGTVNIAHQRMYEVTRNVVDAFKTTPQFIGACAGSSVVSVKYGEMAGTDNKRLTAIGRVELLCDYSY